MSQEVRISRHNDHTVLITISRPKALNALNRKVLESLRDFFTAGYKEYEPFNVVVITGEGDKAFAAGADISEFQDLSASDGQAFAAFGHEVFFGIERFHKPVIAAVNGFALGGGCELAMACHLRVASDNARFGQPEVNLGLIPGYGGTQRLVQYIGKGKAMELLLTGDMLKADAALGLGLVNAVVPAGELMNACDALADKISMKAPLAIRNVIRAVNAYFENTPSGFDAEVEQFGSLMETSDFREGTSAFLEKRAAEFKGE